ncbi:MAG: hypothetical protein RLZZ214_99, partial [Verrucomicrobiota bacterium]
MKLPIPFAAVLLSAICTIGRAGEPVGLT